MEITGSEVTPPVETPTEETPKVDTPAEVTPPSEDTPKIEEKKDEGADPTPPVDPAAPTEVLYELPDGRKVNAETLQKEWKENFLPDYTKKSQRLSAIERGEVELNKPDEKVPKWKDPDYVPESYAEIIQIAKEEAKEDAKREALAEQTKIEAVHNAVNAELDEIKKSDPKLDENALFAHANKYGFQSLKSAHSNMRDMKSVVVNTEKKVVANLKNREADPVSSAASGNSAEDDGYDPKTMSNFGDARDFLAHIKGKK